MSGPKPTNTNMLELPSERVHIAANLPTERALVINRLDTATESRLLTNPPNPTRLGFRIRPSSIYRDRKFIRKILT